MAVEAGPGRGGRGLPLVVPGPVPLGSAGRPHRGDRRDADGPRGVRTVVEADAARAFAIALRPRSARRCMFALPIRRHMARFGTTSEHLGHVAVAIRAHANRNPRAVMVRPAADARRTTRRRAMSPTPTGCSTAAWRPTAPAPWWSPRAERAADARPGRCRDRGRCAGRDAGHPWTPGRCPTRRPSATDPRRRGMRRPGPAPVGPGRGRPSRHRRGPALRQLHRPGPVRPRGLRLLRAGATAGPFAASGALRWPDGGRCRPTRPAATSPRATCRA